MIHRSIFDGLNSLNFMTRKITIIIILAIILGLGAYFATEKRKSASIKKSSTNQLTQEELNKKHCSGGLSIWKDGKFVQIREGKCITEAEYQEYLNAPDYLCNYYQKSIWKESEREYGKKQYKYTEEDLEKIKKLKDEGKALCDSGKSKEGEAKLEEAIKIISFTKMN